MNGDTQSETERGTVAGGRGHCGGVEAGGPVPAAHHPGGEVEAGVGHALPGVRPAHAPGEGALAPSSPSRPHGRPSSARAQLTHEAEGALAPSSPWAQLTRTRARPSSPVCSRTGRGVVGRGKMEAVGDAGRDPREGVTAAKPPGHEVGDDLLQACEGALALARGSRGAGTRTQAHADGRRRVHRGGDARRRQADSLQTRADALLSRADSIDGLIMVGVLADTPTPIPTHT
jgi:hypothetical protein